MHKTPSPSRIPDVVIEAYSLLLQHRIVTITEPVNQNKEEGATGWVFKCVAKVSHPNREKIPPEVSLLVSISEAFPREPVEIFSISEEVSGFPHQEAKSRKLCLYEEYLAPRDASRLVCYVKWAIEWLEDAGKGMLLKPGDPYELPDFSHSFSQTLLPTEYPLIFDESSISYKSWQPHIGEFGHVECLIGASSPAIFAVRFYCKDGSLIRESEFSHSLLREDKKINGKWIIVSDIRYKRHRPPQTYEEMDKLCSKDGLDFYEILKEAWNRNSSCQFGIILIGFPIPKIVGQSLSEIHWQPLLFQNLKGFKAQNPRLRSCKHRRIWKGLKENGCFSSSQQLPWGKVENVAIERLYARGSYSSKVQSTSIAFFGCGALGSFIAELLARGGVNQLNLFDPDSIKFGNFCRHTLDGSYVRSNKALALAKRLSLANPLSKIKGYPVGIPLNSRSDKAIQQVLAGVDVFVDCTANQAAFDWLNQYAIENNKYLISLFFNFHAELLSICISGFSTSCGDIFEDLNRYIQHNQTPLDPKVYFYQPSKEEQVIEGAGCWHPSFPALNAHIQTLAAHAVDIFNHSIDSNQKTGLAVIVKRQSVTQDGVQLGPLIEVVWKKEYP